MAAYLTGKRGGHRRGVGLVVVPKSKARLREKREAAVAAAFAPEESCAREESDEGCFASVCGSHSIIVGLGATYLGLQ